MYMITFIIIFRYDKNHPIKIISSLTVRFSYTDPTDALWSILRMMVIFFAFLFFLCFVVAIFDLLHECGGYILPSLTANSIWKSFLKYE